MHPHPDAHDPDRGTVLSRRQALALFASPVLLGLAGCGGGAEAGPLVGSCVVRPEMTAGPFYLDTDLVRSDIREGRPGTLLALTVVVSRATPTTCEPLPGALVDVWHADAAGDYSGVGASRGTTFLRGVQPTDADGAARFETVYPGWYPGRTPHVHFTVRSPDGAALGYAFTSQLFFDDAVSRAVYATGPYAARSGPAPTNDRDGIFRRGGDEMLLALADRADGGVEARFELALLLD